MVGACHPHRWQGERRVRPSWSRGAWVRRCYRFTLKTDPNVRHARCARIRERSRGSHHASDHGRERQSSQAQPSRRRGADKHPQYAGAVAPPERPSCFVVEMRSSPCLSGTQKPINAMMVNMYSKKFLDVPCNISRRHSFPSVRNEGEGT